MWPASSTLVAFPSGVIDPGTFAAASFALLPLFSVCEFELLLAFGNNLALVDSTYSLVLFLALPKVPSFFTTGFGASPSLAGLSNSTLSVGLAKEFSV